MVKAMTIDNKLEQAKRWFTKHDLRKEWLLRRYSRRRRFFIDNGCDYWKDGANKDNCSFPYCFCYPEWQWERKEQRAEAKKRG